MKRRTPVSEIWRIQEEVIVVRRTIRLAVCQGILFRPPRLKFHQRGRRSAVPSRALVSWVLPVIFHRSAAIVPNAGSPWARARRRAGIVRHVYVEMAFLLGMDGVALIPIFLHRCRAD